MIEANKQCGFDEEDTTHTTMGDPGHGVGLSAIRAYIEGLTIPELDELIEAAQGSRDARMADEMAQATVPESQGG